MYLFLLVGVYDNEWHGKVTAWKDRVQASSRGGSKDKKLTWEAMLPEYRCDWWGGEEVDGVEPRGEE